MKVEGVVSHNFKIIRNNKTKKHRTSNSNSLINNPSTSDIFAKSKNLSFTSDSYKYERIDRKDFELSMEWDWWEGNVSYQRIPLNSLNFYKKTEEELREVAKNLCLYPDDDIKHFCRVLRGWPITIESRKLSRVSYERLMPLVQEEREKVQKYMEIVGLNSNEEAKRGIRLAEFKEQISYHFFRAVAARDLQSDHSASIPNGILLYGNDWRTKKDLSDWMKEKSNLRIVQVEYDRNNPRDSIDKLKEELIVSQQISDTGGKRTLLELKNFDELLSSSEKLESRILIAQFKSLVEDASKNYNTTLLMDTDKDIYSFEPASIGAQRFDIKLDVSRPEEQYFEADREKAKKALIEYRDLGKSKPYYYTRTTRLDYDDVDKIQDY